MWETVVLVMSQVVVQAVTWPLIVALILDVMRSRPRWPRVLPAAAIIVLLLGTALGALVPAWTLVSGAAWWFALPLILGSYPDGRFVPRWILAPVIVYEAYAVAYLVSAGAIADHGGGLVGFSSLILLGAPVYRYLRRATTQERESVRWAILAVLVGVGCFILIMLLEGGTVAEHGPISVAAANLAGVIIPAGLALGMLRPRLIDVDRALVVTVFVFLAAALVGACAAAAWWLVGAGDPTAATVVVAVVVALVTVPAALLARRVAVWLVFHGRLDEEAAVKRLDAVLAGIDDATKAPRVFLDCIVDCLHVPGAVLVGAGHVAAGSGTVGADAAEMPVCYEGETLAVLRVSPRRGESALTANDRRIVHRLAAHVAPALHAARLVGDLRDAHAATVRAREEERRRLRRDLHDDLSPTLSGLGLSAAAISRRARVGDDVSEAAESLVSDVTSAVAQVRELAYDLRPPMLDDLGLVVAIRNRIHGAQADDLDVRVSGDSLPAELPAAVDIAVLRIVQEAVENTRRHAGAQRCDVRLASDGDVLTVSIDDDGQGFPIGRGSGLGLESIRERSRELGGTSEFSRSSLGGAAIRVRLPLAPEVTR